MFGSYVANDVPVLEQDIVTSGSDGPTANG